MVCPWLGVNVQTVACLDTKHRIAKQAKGTHNMIKGINTSGRYLMVSGGTPGSTYISSGAVGAGMMRYNSNMNCIEVNDGNSWQQLSMSYATVELNSDAESLLDWARKERDKQSKRERLAKDNPALQKALEAIARAEANFDLIEKFVENDSNQAEQQVGAWTTSMSVP